jgi:bifunctional UDP-N-acetylglucosamine pyrophosphorylase/glucosamine-1-phosphate N-acetyltransferase
MSTADTVAVILAAGKGTRMKSAYAKALFPLCGKALAFYPIRAAREAGIARVVLVVGHQAEAVKAATAAEGVAYALQEPQNGTGHALQCAEEALRGFTGTIFVHCVDVPLLPADLISRLLATHRREGNAVTVLTTVLPDAGNYGRILRDPADTTRVLRIVEAKDASDEERDVREINGGSYCFEAPLVFELLREVKPNNAQKEIYLTDVIALANARGARVGAVVSPDPGLVEGINDRVQLAETEARLRAAIRRRHMQNGVTLLDPASTFIDDEVVIGQDTTIHPFTIITGKTTIGQRCEIGPSSTLIDMTLEDEVTVLSSRCEGSLLRTGSEVGPFSRLRGGCEICTGAKIGNYSELKKTRVGANSQVHHVGYLGDTTVGEGVNIGAGTITCNYDGKQKHATVIGDGAFIGSGNLLVAPVTIGEDALTGAGSVVTHDVPAGKVAFGVPARVVKDRQK